MRIQGLRTALALALGLLWAAPAARAQVAAPSMDPFTFAEANPATMQWGAPSRVGGAASQGQNVSRPNSGTTNYRGYAAGMRLVSQNLSAAVQAQHEQSTNLSTDVHTDGLGVGLAGKISDNLTLGLGQFHQEALGYNTFSLSATRKDDTPVVGFSLRLGETLFIGATAGKDYAELEDASVWAYNFRTYQDVYQYGIGLRQGGTVLMHLEAYVEERQKFNDPEVLTGKEQSTAAVAEFNYSNVLLGFRQVQTSRDNSLPTTNLTVYEFGVQPHQGLAITLRGEVTEDKYGSAGLYPNSTQTKSVYALAVTYQY